MGAVSETAILKRIIEPDGHTLSAEAARALLALDFSAADRERMHALAVKNQAGALDPQELEELDSYRRIGRLLDLLRSKARQALIRFEPKSAANRHTRP